MLRLKIKKKNRNNIDEKKRKEQMKNQYVSKGKETKKTLYHSGGNIRAKRMAKKKL